MLVVDVVTEVIPLIPGTSVRHGAKLFKYSKTTTFVAFRVGMKYHDEFAQLSLKHLSLNRGRRLLLSKGLRERVTESGRHEFVDDDGIVRVAWDKGTKRWPRAHWHKMVRGNDKFRVNNEGYIVRKGDRKAHIPAAERCK